jgi:hypothetical protein
MVELVYLAAGKQMPELSGDEPWLTIADISLPAQTLLSISARSDAISCFRRASIAS